MLFPVRCMTCKKPISQFHRVYMQAMAVEESRLSFFQRHDIKRPCCRRHFISHVEIYDKLTDSRSVGGLCTDAADMAMRRKRKRQRVETLQKEDIQNTQDTQDFPAAAPTAASADQQ
jgi:DNA-directed RNA polymerase subunit N (RpoN/RPB10)